jgi:sugar/nucleoside kinase (ribokinase family)
MLTDRGANEETSPADVTDRLLATHQVLHVTGHVFAGPDRDDAWQDLFARAGLAGLTTSVAPGSAGHLRTIGPDRFLRIVAGVDLLIAGLEEAQLLTGHGDPVTAALGLAAAHPLVVVTLGADGSVIATVGGAVRVPAAAAEVVDVTGAGDAYAAGLLAALLGGATDAEAGERAAALAAQAVARIGARP